MLLNLSNKMFILVYFYLCKFHFVLFFIYIARFSHHYMFSFKYLYTVMAVNCSIFFLSFLGLFLLTNFSPIKKTFSFLLASGLLIFYWL